MKAKKLVGAIALTAALAMGTMPAFATTSNWYDAGGEFTNGVQMGTAATSDNTAAATVTDNTANAKKASGSTKVYASVYDADINVTVPVAIAIAFANQGISDIKAPSNYTVTNNSPDHAVEISKIEGTSATFDLKTFGASDTASAPKSMLNIVLDGTTLDATNGIATPGVTLNTANPTHTFDFTGSQAFVKSPLTAGYLASSVANINLTFKQVTA